MNKLTSLKWKMIELCSTNENVKKCVTDYVK
jgi:hypothetical protein